MKQEIKEIRDKSNLWFKEYLYKKSLEFRKEEKDYRNSWSKKMDSMSWMNRTVDFTGVITGWSRYKKESLYESNKHFFNRLHSLVFTRRRRQLQRFVVVEKGSENKTIYHSHMLIEIPKHLSEDEFKELILECWRKTSNGKKSIDHESFGVESNEERIKSFFTKHRGLFSLGFGGYMIKEFTDKTDTVDTENSFWYEDIRSRSLIS